MKKLIPILLLSLSLSAFAKNKEKGELIYTLEGSFQDNYELYKIDQSEGAVMFAGTVSTMRIDTVRIEGSYSEKKKSSKKQKQSVDVTLKINHKEVDENNADMIMWYDDHEVRYMDDNLDVMMNYSDLDDDSIEFSKTTMNAWAQAALGDSLKKAVVAMAEEREGKGMVAAGYNIDLSRMQCDIDQATYKLSCYGNFLISVGVAAKVKYN